jgi:hypothetical protein
MKNELQLSVNTLELGTLTTNAISIRDKVKEMLVNYDSKNYSEDTIDKAKEDKALLNTTSKALNDERIRLEKEFMQPFEDFKFVVTETTTMIKDASSKIDLIVKEVENRAKEQRKAIIENIYKDSIGELNELITLNQIFDEKWLNKGSFNDKGEFKLIKDLEDKLNKIRNDLESIKALKSKHELSLVNQYLKDFNLGNVIVENNRLNELELKQVVVEEKKEELRKEESDQIVNTVVEVEDTEEIRVYELQITGTLE